MPSAAIRDNVESGDVILVEMPEGIEELIPAFLTTQKEGAATLVEMLSASELDGIRRFAHNLKGTGTAFGFPKLSEIGVSMERSACEANLSDLTGQIKTLTDYLDRVRVRRKGE
jgi:HPt (histidine-containing phosphotransfer) domain-containing protein